MVVLSIYDQHCKTAQQLFRLVVRCSGLHLMEFMASLITDLGNWIRPWVDDIATAVVTCLLVMFAADINRFMRKQLVGTNFIVRTIIFILINAFGYGFFIVSTAPLLSTQLSQLANHWLITVITILFIVIGVWAQRHRQQV